MQAMSLEHCASYGHDISFTTPNYQITTTPKKEWGIVALGESPAQEDMRHGRRILDLALDRHWASDGQVLGGDDDDATATAPARKLVTDAGLQQSELTAVIQYTGPMVRAHPLMYFLLPSYSFLTPPFHGTALPQYDLFNCLLRRFPKERFDKYLGGGNLFSTTIAVLASAIQKIARIACIQEGTTFYRGLSRLMELPDEFHRPDAQGRRGFAEWGFLSTTSDKDVALAYSYAGQGQTGPIPMVLKFRSSAVDRGASIDVFSQYPKARPTSHLPPPIP